MTEVWKIVIAALGGYTVIFGGLFWWLGQRRLQSLLERERGDTQKELEHLKARFSTEESIRALLSGSFSNAQSQVFEKRLESIEALWQSFFGLRNSIPGYITYVDIILEGEFQEWIKRTDIQEIFGELSIEKITEMSTSVSGDIEKVRVFVGEYLWSLYFVYRAFSFRLVIFLFYEREKESPTYWKNDNGLEQILKPALSSDEWSTFQSKKIGSIQY